VELIKAEF